jgi:D-arabinose 1-dehydrogenase-like Zn-dependent alcohol dehydrogenase
MNLSARREVHVLGRIDPVHPGHAILGSVLCVSNGNGGIAEGIRVKSRPARYVWTCQHCGETVKAHKQAALSRRMARHEKCYEQAAQDARR